MSEQERRWGMTDEGMPDYSQMSDGEADAAVAAWLAGDGSLMDALTGAR